MAGDYLIDDKSTIKDSISITKDMLVKINREAREAGKKPALSISFTNMGLAAKTWVCIPIDDFEEFVNDV